jgi:hypothetical protein
MFRIRPSSTLPICLDVGVNTQKILDDPLYLGLRQKRISDAEMTDFMDEFMREITTAFPKLLVQFEVRYCSQSYRCAPINICLAVRTLPRKRLSSTLTDSGIHILFSTTTSKELGPLFSVAFSMPPSCRLRRRGNHCLHTAFSS